MTEAVRKQVKLRAGFRCEYCQLHQDDSPLASLHVEHIRPRKHGGSDDVSNLCLACIDCNLHKGPNLTGIDPDSGSIIQLFDPRVQRWNEHFLWEGIRVVGRTPVGRTTVVVLNMNSESQLGLRAEG
ncbi:MAG: HNH endonuclease [Prosthecobacter sp.]